MSYDINNTVPDGDNETYAEAASNQIEKIHQSFNLWEEERNVRYFEEEVWDTVHPLEANVSDAAEINFVLHQMAQLNLMYSPNATLYLKYHFVDEKGKAFDVSTSDKMFPLKLRTQGNLAHGLFETVSLVNDGGQTIANHDYPMTAFMMKLLYTREMHNEEMVRYEGMPLLSLENKPSQEKMLKSMNTITDRGTFDADDAEYHKARTKELGGTHTYKFKPLLSATNTDRLVPGNVKFRLRLRKADPSTLFQCKNGGSIGKVVIDEAKMVVVRKKPTNEVMKSIVSKMIKEGHIQYPVMKTHNTRMTPQSMKAHITHRLNLGDMAMPTRMAIVFVDTKVSGGGSTTAPTYVFENPGIKSMKLKFGSRWIPDYNGFSFKEIGKHTNEGKTASEIRALCVEDEWEFDRMFAAYKVDELNNKLRYNFSDFLSGCRTMFFFDTTADQSAAQTDKAALTEGYGPLELDFTLHETTTKEYVIYMLREYHGSMVMDAVTGQTLNQPGED